MAPNVREPIAESPGERAIAGIHLGEPRNFQTRTDQRLPLSYRAIMVIQNEVGGMTCDFNETGCK
jgi:hypothetical protein